MKGNYLSVLKQAGAKAITYYDGNNPKHISHLKDCTLLCHHALEGVDVSVETIRSDNPQLDFYKLSKSFKEDYLDNPNLIFSPATKAYIHKEAEIGHNVIINPGTVIGKSKIDDHVEIHANTVIYAKTHIHAGSIIESNTTIGGAGMMWVWDGAKKVYLEQLGSTIIEEDCRIGTQCEIVRGSANEATRIQKGTCIAHGSMLGHGCQIGVLNHFANGIKLGGGCATGPNNFLGSGVIFSAGAKVLASDVIIGAGAVVTKNITESGVYVGTPAKYLKPVTERMSGLPRWNR